MNLEKSLRRTFDRELVKLKHDNPPTHDILATDEFVKVCYKHNKRLFTVLLQQVSNLDLTGFPGKLENESLNDNAKFRDFVTDLESTAKIFWRFQELSVPPQYQETITCYAKKACLGIDEFIEAGNILETSDKLPNKFWKLSELQISYIREALNQTSENCGNIRMRP